VKGLTHKIHNDYSALGLGFETPTSGRSADEMQSKESIRSIGRAQEGRWVIAKRTKPKRARN
jgi:hypothetical protein